MIKINSTDLNIDKYFDYVKKYMEERSTKYKLEQINNELKELLDLDLYEVMSLEPKEIRKLINSLNEETFSTNIEGLKSFYNVFRDEWGVELLNDLNLNVCPFCNREYVFTF